MSQKVKLISKLKTVPKDFTYDDAKALLEWLGYKESNKGKQVVLECLSLKIIH